MRGFLNQLVGFGSAKSCRGRVPGQSLKVFLHSGPLAFDIVLPVPNLSLLTGLGSGHWAAVRLIAVSSFCAVSRVCSN